MLRAWWLHASRVFSTCLTTRARWGRDGSLRSAIHCCVRGVPSHAARVAWTRRGLRATQAGDGVNTVSASFARGERAGRQSIVLDGLAGAIEALFLVILVTLPLDAYLVLPSGRVLGFLSQALTVELCALYGLTIALNALLREPIRLAVRLRDLAPLTATTFAALASSITATSHSVALKECLKALVYLGIFLVARALMKRRQMRYHALLALVVGLALVLIIGFFGVTPGAPDIAGDLLNIHRTAAGLPNSTISRAESTFRYPNELAAYLVLLIPLLVACAVTTRDIVERVGFLLLAVAGAALMLLTYTRSGELGLSVALIVLLWTLGGRKQGLAGIAALVCGGLALVFIPGPVSARLITAFTGSDGWQVFRLAAWKWALTIFAHHPLLGVGIGNIGLQPNAPILDAAHHLREANAENLLLNVLAEMGIPGALAIVFCLIAALRVTSLGVRSATTWLDRGWDAGVFAGLIGIIVFGVTDPILISGQVTGLLCALVGLAGAGAHTMLAEPAAATIPERETAWEPLLAPALAAAERRIVFLLNSRVLGGVETHTLNLAAELRSRGADTLIVIPPNAAVEPFLIERGQPYRVERLGAHLGRWCGYLGTLTLANPFIRAHYSRVISSLDRESPSVFVCPLPREQALVTPLKRSHDLYVVWITHSPLHFTPHRLIVAPMLRSLSRHADAHIVISESLAELLADDQYATQRMVVIPNAVAAAPTLVTPFKERPRATIGFAGRLTANKGVRYLIAAMPEVLIHHPEARLLIAGTGAEERRLRRQVARLHLKNHVTFLGQVNDMRPFYGELTLLAHPTVDYEGLPTVILEAQYAGVPVVASAVMGVMELIIDDDTGVLAWPGVSGSLARAITHVLDSPSLARRIALAGWWQARSRYTIDRAAARFANVIALLDDTSGVSMARLTESREIHAAQRSRLVRDTGVLLAGKILTALATALWTVLAARALPASTYGDLMLCAGLVDIAAVLTDAGLTAAATQELTSASPSHAQRLVGTVFWLKLLMGAIAGGVAIGAVFALPFTPEARNLMALLAPGLVFISLTSLSLLFRARRNVSYTLLAALAAAGAGSYGAISVFLSAPTADGFAKARLLMLAVFGVITLALVGLKYRPHWGFDWQSAKRLLGTSALLGVALALNILYYRIDVPLLALLSGSASVAVYTSAYRVLDVATLLPVTAATAALPLLIAQPTRERLGAFVSQFLELALVIGLFIGVTLTVFAHPILSALYGDRYDNAYPTLVALAWVAGFTLITNVYSPLTVAMNRRRLLMVASGVALVANVALNFVLIPMLGSLGAALATLATEIVVTMPLAWASGRALRVRPHARPVIAALLATSVWLAAWYFFGARARQHIDSDWLMALAYVGVWLVVFEMIAPTWAWAVVRTARRRSEQMQANRPHHGEDAHGETIAESDPPMEDAAITYALEEQRS